MTQTNAIPRAIPIDEFIPMVGQIMLADCHPRPAQLVLSAVHPYPRQFSARVPFTLIFRSSVEIQLVAGMYPLRCGEFGPDIVYLEPMISPRDGAPGNYYQAVFN